MCRSIYPVATGVLVAGNPGSIHRLQHGFTLSGRVHPFPPDKEAGSTPGIDSPDNSMQAARGDFATLIC